MGAKELKARLLERVGGGEGFPVTSAPYCVLGDELGVQEIDALNALLELRHIGAIRRIGARFADKTAIGFCSTFDAEELVPAPIGGVEVTCDDAELLMLIADDIPYGERPFAELAAELEMRGIDVDEAWVLSRIRSWIDSGLIETFGAEV